MRRKPQVTKHTYIKHILALIRHHNRLIRELQLGRNRSSPLTQLNSLNSQIKVGRLSFEPISCEFG